jgi:hypothetical protein
MSTQDPQTVQLAITHDFLVGIGPLIIGICIVALLITSVWFGRRRSADQRDVPHGTRARSAAWQTPQKGRNGGADDHGAGYQGDGHRTHESREIESDEVPRDGRRRLPHEMGDAGVHAGRPRTRPRRHSGPNVD